MRSSRRYILLECKQSSSLKTSKWFSAVEDDFLNEESLNKQESRLAWFEGETSDVVNISDVNKFIVQHISLSYHLRDLTSRAIFETKACCAR